MSLLNRRQRRFRAHDEHTDSSAALRPSGIYAMGQCSPRTISHRDYDLADLGVAQHVRVRIRNPLERERAVEHWFERSCGERAQQVGSETLTTDQRLLR